MYVSPRYTVITMSNAQSPQEIFIKQNYKELARGARWLVGKHLRAVGGEAMDNAFCRLPNFGMVELEALTNHMIAISRYLRLEEALKKNDKEYLQSLDLTDMFYVELFQRLGEDNDPC